MMDILPLVLDFLSGLFIDPFAMIAKRPDRLVQLVIQGLSAGVMYSLIALGFVLIFKASGVFNFAQGIMVVFAGLSVVTLIEMGMPAIVAIAGAIVVMVVMAMCIEKAVLRPLVNQPGIVLFMATIGLAFFLEGLARSSLAPIPRPCRWKRSAYRQGASSSVKACSVAMCACTSWT